MLSKAAYRHLSRMTSLAELASFLKANAPKTRKSVKLARGRKQEKDARHMLETARLRADVFERAGGRCEVRYGGDSPCACGRTATDMDHWLGGTGRRRQRQSVETCWALCRDHHDWRTLYVGGVGFWNNRFKAHCDRYGYPFEPHIEHAPLPEKQAVK